MLFVNKKYESLDRLLNEKLSDKAADSFSEFIKNNPDLEDDDVDSYKKLLTSRAKYKSGNSKYNYDTFFKRHGFSNFRNETCAERFVKVFSDSDKIDLFNKIILDNGVTSIGDIKTSGNVYNDFCNDFKEEAKVIASWNDNSSSTMNMGKFENLLRFIIRESSPGKGDANGDVGISDSTALEVKQCGRTSDNKSDSGPRMKGEKTINSPMIIYESLDEELVTNKDERGKTRYNSPKGIVLFNSRVSDYLSKGGTLVKLADCLLEGVCKQYNIGDLSIKSSDVANFLSDKMESQALTDIIGALQLCAYHVQEQFGYFIIIDEISGKYFFTNSFNLSLLLSHLRFKGPWAANKSDYACKAFLK